MIIARDSIMTASLLTPPGFGGIAVIGIVGSESGSLLAGIFTPVSKVAFADMLSGRFYLGQIRDGEEIIDQVMLLVDSGGNSAEIHCHGGPRIIQRLMILLKSLGVSVIDWHIQTGLDSIEAEQSYHLSRARTPLAVSLLACQYPEGLFQWCRNWIHYAGLKDFSPADYHQAAQILLNTSRISHRLLNPARVALIGMPNAGKSSLANKLTGRSQSLVSDLPGTTRDWTAELIEIAGLPIELIDTAGLRDSDDELEILSIERVRELLAGIDLAIILVPASCITNFAGILASYRVFLPTELEILPVISRSDELNLEFSDYSELRVSSVSGQGIEQLKAAIARKLGLPDDFNYRRPAIFTARQHDTIASTLSQSDHSSVISSLLACIGGIS